MDLSLDKVRSYHTATSSVGTGATDLESSFSESTAFLNASMDFDRHSSERRVQAETESWEDSFALDEAARSTLQTATGLATVMEGDGDDSTTMQALKKSFQKLGTSDSSMNTRSTDLESSISESTFNASMDFDRHSSAQQSQRFQMEDSTNWEDSFALDDGAQPRAPLQTAGLETVPEPQQVEEEV